MKTCSKKLPYLCAAVLIALELSVPEACASDNNGSLLKNLPAGSAITFRRELILPASRFHAPDYVVQDGKVWPAEKSTYWNHPDFSRPYCEMNFYDALASGRTFHEGDRIALDHAVTDFLPAQSKFAGGGSRSITEFYLPNLAIWCIGRSGDPGASDDRGLTVFELRQIFGWSITVDEPAEESAKLDRGLSHDMNRALAVLIAPENGGQRESDEVDKRVSSSEAGNAALKQGTVAETGI